MNKKAMFSLMLLVSSYVFGVERFNNTGNFLKRGFLPVVGGVGGYVLHRFLLKKPRTNDKQMQEYLTGAGCAAVAYGLMSGNTIARNVGAGVTVGNLVWTDYKLKNQADALRKLQADAVEKPKVATPSNEDE